MCFFNVKHVLLVISDGILNPIASCSVIQSGYAVISPWNYDFPLYISKSRLMSPSIPAKNLCP